MTPLQVKPYWQKHVDKCTLNLVPISGWFTVVQKGEMASAAHHDALSIELLHTPIVQAGLEPATFSLPAKSK